LKARMDFVTYENQLKACQLTGGLVPHPAFQPMKSANGMPLTTPWQVCALGQIAEDTKPAYRPRPNPEDCSRPWAVADEVYSAPILSTPPAVAFAPMQFPSYVASAPV